MKAGIPEGLLAGFHPQVPEKSGMGLYGVALVVVVGGVDEFETQIVPNGLQDGLANGEDVHVSLRSGHALDGKGAFGEADSPNVLTVIEDGLFELL